MSKPELLLILSAIFMSSGMTPGIAALFGWAFLAWGIYSAWRGQ